MNANTGETYNLGTYDGTVAALMATDAGDPVVEVTAEEAHDLEGLSRAERRRLLKGRRPIQRTELEESLDKLRGPRGRS
jgi:hypothetical protein